jgi:hypothetical protein
MSHTVICLVNCRICSSACVCLPGETGSGTATPRAGSRRRVDERRTVPPAGGAVLLLHHSAWVECLLLLVAWSHACILLLAVSTCSHAWRGCFGRQPGHKGGKLLLMNVLHCTNADQQVGRTHTFMQMEILERDTGFHFHILAVSKYLSFSLFDKQL